jgi:hypothetical protein
MDGSLSRKIEKLPPFSHGLEKSLQLTLLTLSLQE